MKTEVSKIRDQSNGKDTGNAERDALSRCGRYDLAWSTVCRMNRAKTVRKGNEKDLGRKSSGPKDPDAASLTE